MVPKRTGTSEKEIANQPIEEATSGMQIAFHSWENCCRILTELDREFILAGRLREFSEMDMITKNCTVRITAKMENMLDVDVLDRANPPSKFPKIPVTDENDNTMAWIFPVEFVCLPTSAAIASWATSTIEAPTFPRRRKMVRVIFVMQDGGRKIMDSHEITCNKTAFESQLIK